MTSERDEQFGQYVLDRRAELVRTARLITGGDHHLAEDLVQTTLTKLYVKWPAFRRAGNPGGYAYRIMVNALTDERRRPWWRRERSTASLPDIPQAEPGLDREGVDELMTALRGLPPRMRATLVFRYFHGLDVAETAGALGCSESSVKTQTARGLQRLREGMEATSGPMGYLPGNVHP
ncbi:SigE family RNA polymerase sigma factor [Micromonospora sp. DT233]|uniref:SigE family RNA polymerase sigma factor n=1 Tax=Micromonospora sp. DT233 TaxID=3393432 RepID=UPI003CEEF350